MDCSSSRTLYRTRVRWSDRRSSLLISLTNASFHDAFQFVDLPCNQWAINALLRRVLHVPNARLPSTLHCSEIHHVVGYSRFFLECFLTAEVIQPVPPPVPPVGPCSASSGFSTVPPLLAHHPMTYPRTRVCTTPRWKSSSSTSTPRNPSSTETCWYYATWSFPRRRQEPSAFLRSQSPLIVSLQNWIVYVGDTCICPYRTPLQIETFLYVRIVVPFSSFQLLPHDSAVRSLQKSRESVVPATLSPYSTPSTHPEPGFSIVWNQFMKRLQSIWKVVLWKKNLRDLRLSDPLEHW